MHGTLLTVHIITAAIGLLSGFVALYASKGAALHRGGGRLFVYSMIAMALLGAAIAGVWSRAASVNIPAGLLTTYLVVTGLTTVARRRRGSRWFDVGLMLVALAVSVTMLSLGVGVLVRGKNTGFIVPFFAFAAIALMGAAGDVRTLRSGAPTGSKRLARHLWRMSTALLIGVLSFSTRLPRILPAALRTPIAYSLPMVVVLVTMFYWLWHVRSTRPSGGAVAVRRTDLAIEGV
jgi:uncharacterized membrane protein